MSNLHMQDIEQQEIIQPKVVQSNNKKRFYQGTFVGAFFLCSSAFLINAGAIKVFGLAVPESKLGITETSTTPKKTIKILEDIPILGDFFNGKLQANVEKAVTRYFIPREDVLLANYSFNNALNDVFYEVALPKKTLVPLDDGNNIRFLDKEHHIMLNLSPMEESAMAISMEKSAQFFNQLYEAVGGEVGLYIYGVTTPYHVPELNEDYGLTGYNSKGYAYLQAFGALLNPAISFKTLDVQTLQAYSELFYATDHHWNMYGGYKGYKEMMTMMGKEEEIKEVAIKPLEGVVFRGSIARLSANNSLSDTFYIPEVDLGEYDVVINSNPTSNTKLNKRDTLVQNSKTNPFLSCYSEYFREDFASVMYDFKQPEKTNLLMIGDSMTNSVEDLIASHYNKTYVLDLRLYKQKYGENLDIKKFIKEYHIQDVLFLTQSQGCLTDNSPNIIIK